MTLPQMSGSWAAERQFGVGREIERPLNGHAADRLLMAGQSRPVDGFDGQVRAA